MMSQEPGGPTGGVIGVGGAGGGTTTLAPLLLLPLSPQPLHPAMLTIVEMRRHLIRNERKAADLLLLLRRLHGLNESPLEKESTCFTILGIGGSNGLAMSRSEVYSSPSSESSIPG